MDWIATILSLVVVIGAAASGLDHDGDDQSASPADEESFSTIHGPATFTIKVEEQGPIELSIYVSSGVSKGATLEGPGACSGALPDAIVVAASGGAYRRYDCSDLSVGTHRLVIDGGAIVAGKLRIDGASFG